MKVLAAINGLYINPIWYGRTFYIFREKAIDNEKINKKCQ